MKPVHRTHLRRSNNALRWGLDTEAQAAYQQDGVLIVEDFLDAQACAELRAQAERLVEVLAPQSPATVFSTRDQRHARDAYFESTAAGMGVFFEEEALDAQGQLKVPLSRAVNKLGHAMHDLDPVFQRHSHGPRWQAVAEGVGLADPLLVQSMYIFKQPGIGGEVNCHQDATFLSTQPQSVVGFWLAIEDAHQGNGCLGGLPGEHAKGLKELFRRDPDGVLRLHPIHPRPEWDMQRLQWLAVPRGSLIVFHGLFPHLSLANRLAQSRHAYTLHAVSAGTTYAKDNWIQRDGPQNAPFSGFIDLESATRG